MGLLWSARRRIQYDHSALAPYAFRFPGSISSGADLKVTRKRARPSPPPAGTGHATDLEVNHKPTTVGRRTGNER